MNTSESSSTHSPQSTSMMVDLVKSENQDFEWYPTTDEILDTIKAHMDAIFYSPSVLDCGAGDGRSLMSLTQGRRYAIEKSRPLLEAMDHSIYVVGTEFHEQTLIDKKVDVVFCNPPYSEYSQWMIKIIREANARRLYFVAPKRWSGHQVVQDAIELRSAEVKVLGEFDFISAERQARATVEIVCINLGFNSFSHRGCMVDPFHVWFSDNFKLDVNQEKSSHYDFDRQLKNKVQSGLQGELVEGGDLITALDRLYRRDLEKLIGTYKSLQEVDVGILRELDVNMDGVERALRQKIEGLKDVYWHELFNNLGKITDRLTQGTRRKMLDTLTENTHVDFTVSNAYAVIMWVLKNANVYLDDQLVSLVKRMTGKANIRLYKSNKLTFGDDAWRYGSTPEDLARYALDYRIVLHRIGGIDASSWDRERYHGLAERAYHFINDILTVANNIGFDTSSMQRAGTYQWESNAL